MPSRLIPRILRVNHALAHAEAHHNTRGVFARALSAFVSAATETLIFISTRGDSLRLKSALAAH